MTQDYLQNIIKCELESEIEDINKLLYFDKLHLRCIKKGHTDGIVPNIFIQECKILKDRNVTLCPFLAALTQAYCYICKYNLNIKGIILNSDKYFTVININYDFLENFRLLYDKYNKDYSPSNFWKIEKVRVEIKNLKKIYNFYDNISLLFNPKFNIDEEINKIKIWI